MSLSQSTLLSIWVLTESKKSSWRFFSFKNFTRHFSVSSRFSFAGGTPPTTKKEIAKMTKLLNDKKRDLKRVVNGRSYTSSRFEMLHDRGSKWYYLKYSLQQKSILQVFFRSSEFLRICNQVKLLKIYLSWNWVSHGWSSWNLTASEVVNWIE